MNAPTQSTQLTHKPVRGAAGVGRMLGPLVALAIWVTPAAVTRGLAGDAQITAGITAWIAIWWMTEAIPLAATALLPAILFPLAGVLTIDEAATPYANKFVLLFLGGFMIARAIERWNLHRRIALLTVLTVGTQPRRLIAGFMISTAILSMWISNTAATVVMLPIGISLVSLLTDRLGEDFAGGPSARTNFATCLMLGVAYSASIGGLSTLIGTPTNLLLARFAETQGIEVSFAEWMRFAVPLSATMLVLTWILLTFVIFPIRVKELPGGQALIRGELVKLGAVTRAEWTVLAVFTLTALAWVLRAPLTNWEWLTTQVPPVGRLNDTVIALIGTLTLFVLPIDAKRGIFALDWETAVNIPWGLLLLFGGGFSLAAAIASSQLADWIGGQVAGLAGLPTWLLVAVVVAIVVFLTELTSNTPTAAVFLPILYGVAQGLDVDPMLFLTPATIAATCAFMLPVATPPNAIVFGSGHIEMPQMIRAGLVLNCVSIVLIPLWVWAFGSF